ncbi:MFS transporter [Streptomyces zagrosensis]|uniref:MFS family permease n=1 Tax=Streptomyces zagrosensis TaxID=1042984 RepID=A0A7W9QC99_9ACTN|nr:MFS transporter [Streptomyces zagrosensis]MBB5937598.1 MFS family permease [Streptomyces zagrosensis]
MPNPYREIFAAPGAAGFCAAGFLGRMPVAMMTIGVVTMISEITGRYGLAGALAATLALSGAVIGPQLSRLVDLHGQRRMLRPAVLVSLTAISGLLLCARRGWPDWLMFVCAACGGCVPSLGSMIRSRWANIYRSEPRRLHTAYSFESVVDEICFIVGPIISIGLSTTWFPEAGPLMAAGFLATGVFWLTAQRATEPVPQPRDERHPKGSALRSPGLRILVVTGVFAGTIFSSVDVVTVAFAEEQGHKSAASLILATYAAGSCLAGAVFGLMHLTGPPARRWLLGVCAMAASMIPLQFVSNLTALTCALFIAGLAIAPTGVTIMSLVQEHVPRTKLTEGMTWASTGIATGIALGAFASGRVVDAAGAEAAYAVPAIAGATAVVLALLGYHRVTPAAQHADCTPRAQGGADTDGQGDSAPQGKGDGREACGREACGREEDGREEDGREQQPVA